MNLIRPSYVLASNSNLWALISFHLLIGELVTLVLQRDH